MNLPRIPKLNTIPRISKDKHINPYGSKFIQTCVSHNLRTANGRISDDNLGQMTCYNYEGASVVDYFF